jgi:hypothetical protein
LNITRITLALAVVAAAGLSTSDLRAQEYTLAPAPNLSAEGGFSAENDPCLWATRVAMHSPGIGAMVRGMLGCKRGGGGSGTRALTYFDFQGTWDSYVFIDGQYINELSLTAVEAGPPRKPQPTPPDLTPPDEPETHTEHAPVPQIGKGYGSNVLTSRSLVIRVAPGPKPTMYNGIPIVERGRSWERIETANGRHIWRQSVLVDNSDGSGNGVGERYTSADRANTRMPESAADRRIHRQEGTHTAPRSAASRPSSSSGTSSASSPSSRTKSAPRGASKAVKQ